jgi:5-methylcytosine-specific restriction endonuclease McrA
MFVHVKQAIKELQKENASLQPELLSAAAAQRALEEYAQVKRLADFGIAALTRKVNDASAVARVTGTSIGKAKETVATGKMLKESDELGEALRFGDVSLDQATEIAKAEESAPGVAKELIKVAKKESFQVLRDASRKAKLEAEQRNDLAERQRKARSARTYVDELGMVNIPLKLEPHVGTPILNRAEAEAKRLHQAAKRNGSTEPFECHLADAYAKMLAGKGKACTTRPELVVVVSHEVAKRGWNEIRRGEVCKIPGTGPIAPKVAREIAQRALISVAVSDGKDLRHFKRFSRSIPKEVRIALELGDPPDFDGIRCVDCGNHLNIEIDHIEPVVAREPTSTTNCDPRCWPCHQAKTERDRKAGRLKRPETRGPTRRPLRRSDAPRARSRPRAAT